MSDSVNTMLGKKVERTKKEKVEKISKEADLKEIKRKLDVEKEKERRKEAARKTNQQPQQELLSPNNTLFVESLTKDVTDVILTNLFSQYSGFK